MKYILSILLPVLIALSACQPIVVPESAAPAAGTVPEESAESVPVAVNFYTSQAGHERFGMIDLATGAGTDIGKYTNDEVEILRTAWFSGGGAVYEDTFYTILNKRLPADATPADAEARLARVDMATGAVELVGDIIPVNMIAMEINRCGEIFSAGFTLSNDIGELFGDTNLYQVDGESGAITLIGDTGLERIMDMSFSPDGTLWATTGNVLYTLDQETGAPTEVATITGVEDDNEIMGIGFTTEGELYATTPFSDGFYRLDPESGEVTEIGRHGFTVPHGGDIPMEIQGMNCEDAEESTTEADSDTDAAAGIGFYTSHEGHEHLGMIDLASGSGSDIGKYENPEINILRTEWPLGNGAIYDGAIYGLTAKRLPADATRDEAVSRLVRVDMESGAVELLGDPINLNMLALEVDACGTMYAAGFDFSNEFGVMFGDTNLYTIDRETAALTLVGDTGIERLMDMAFDPEGTLWATESNMLYTLDPATGASAEVVPITGVDEGVVIMGLGFTDDGTLYATSPESELFYTIDLATGETTVVGQHGLFFPHGGDIPMVPHNVSCEGN